LTDWQWQSARTLDVAAVGDMICSQEDKPGTSKSTRHIAKVVGTSDRSVRRIAKNDLQLSAFRRMPAQVLSDAVKLKQLERCRELLHFAQPYFCYLTEYLNEIYICYRQFLRE